MNFFDLFFLKLIHFVSHFNCLCPQVRLSVWSSYVEPTSSTHSRSQACGWMSTWTRSQGNLAWSASAEVGCSPSGRCTSQTFSPDTNRTFTWWRSGWRTRRAPLRCGELCGEAWVWSIWSQTVWSTTFTSTAFTLRTARGRTRARFWGRSPSRCISRRWTVWTTDWWTAASWPSRKGGNAHRSVGLVLFYFTSLLESVPSQKNKNFPPSQVLLDLNN